MSNKVEIAGYDEHSSHLRRREVGLFNGGLKVYEPTLTTIDESLNNIELDIDKIGDCVNETDNKLNVSTFDTTQDTNLTFNGGALNDGQNVIIDCIGYRAVRVWGEVSNDQLEITATCATNTGNLTFWDAFGMDTYTGKFSHYYQDPPRHIKYQNNSGNTITSINLQFTRFK